MRIEVLVDDGPKHEDTWLVHEPVYGVFDGATSYTNYVDGAGKTGGQLAAEIARDTFHENNQELPALARLANERIKAKMDAAGIDQTDKVNWWSTAAAVIRISHDRQSFEWVQIGDSIPLLVYRDGSHKLLVEDYDHDRAVLKLWQEHAQQKKKNIRALLQDGPLTMLRRSMNEAYGVLNGYPEALSFLRSGTEPLANIQTIILLTDGLILPKEEPNDPDDFATFVQLYQRGGLQHVASHVRSVETNDPHGWQYPRFKQYDDITAIALTPHPHY